mgnify:CR=1 FL=1
MNRLIHFSKYSKYLKIIIAFIVCLLPAQQQDNNALYNEYCASCHGLNGDGKGEFSYLLYPKPRDLSKGQFKLRSTEQGQPPLDRDINNTIRNGMPGTAMPSFSFLKDSEIKSLVDIVKEFSSIENENVHPLNIPDELPVTDELIELGKMVYTDTGCNMCHGDLGKGDGPSSNQLKDTQGFPIVPKDFTSGVYLGGGTKKELYYRFVAGMDGTPMPSFGNLAELLGRPKVEESKLAWALIHYVKSLETSQNETIKTLPENGIILAEKTRRFIRPDEMMDSFSRHWDKVALYSIPLSRLWQSDNVNYQMVNVQAMYNNRYLAVKLEWEDNTQDQGLSRIQDFQDGAAIQFSLDGTKGFHGMGSKDHPADIWFWKAEWQKRVTEKSQPDIDLVYANRVSDSNVETYPKLMNDVAYLSGRDAGNIISSKSKKSSVENVTAVGPETVTPLTEKDQQVFGKGVWDGKKWRVVFVRKLKSDDAKKVNFAKGNQIPIGFAFWNGSERDRNGQKMVSTWYDLELKD